MEDNKFRENPRKKEPVRAEQVPEVAKDAAEFSGGIVGNEIGPFASDDMPSDHSEDPI